MSGMLSRIFQNFDTGNGRKRYKLPIDIYDTITPKTVSEIIKWAVKGTDAECVEWDGRDVTV